MSLNDTSNHPTLKIIFQYEARRLFLPRLFCIHFEIITRFSAFHLENINCASVIKRETGKFLNLIIIEMKNNITKK